MDEGEALALYRLAVLQELPGLETGRKRQCEPERREGGAGQPRMRGAPVPRRPTQWVESQGPGQGGKEAQCDPEVREGRGMEERDGEPHGQDAPDQGDVEARRGIAPPPGPHARADEPEAEDRVREQARRQVGVLTPADRVAVELEDVEIVLHHLGRRNAGGRVGLGDLEAPPERGAEAEERHARANREPEAALQLSAPGPGSLAQGTQQHECAHQTGDVGELLAGEEA